MIETFIEFLIVLMGLEGSGTGGAGTQLPGVEWHSVSRLIDRAALPWKNSFFHSGGFFKREDWWEGRGFEWYLAAEHAHAALSCFHREKFARIS